MIVSDQNHNQYSKTIREYLLLYCEIGVKSATKPIEIYFAPHSLSEVSWLQSPTLDPLNVTGSRFLSDVGFIPF